MFKLNAEREGDGGNDDDRGLPPAHLSIDEATYSSRRQATHRDSLHRKSVRHLLASLCAGTASPLSLPSCLSVLANHSGGGSLQDSVAGGINDWLAEGAASLTPSHTHTHTPHTHAWWQRAKCANLGSVADH